MKNGFQSQLPRCMICFATQEIRLRDGRPALRGPAPRKTGCPAPLRKTPLLPRPDPPRRSGQNWLNKKKWNKFCNTKLFLSYLKLCVFFDLVWNFFLRCAFPYASSDHETLCRSSCIACRQKVSRRCVKACDTSYYCSDCKNSCTVYKQRAFLQCEWACESSDFEIEWRNSHTAHNWKASLLNGFACKS